MSRNITIDELPSAKHGLKIIESQTHEQFYIVPVAQYDTTVEERDALKSAAANLLQAAANELHYQDSNSPDRVLAAQVELQRAMAGMRTILEEGTK